MLPLGVPVLAGSRRFEEWPAEQFASLRPEALGSLFSGRHCRESRDSPLSVAGLLTSSGMKIPRTWEGRSAASAQYSSRSSSPESPMRMNCEVRKSSRILTTVGAFAFSCGSNQLREQASRTARIVFETRWLTASDCF